jgi:hypothetical protein
MMMMMMMMMLLVALGPDHQWLGLPTNWRQSKASCFASGQVGVSQAHTIMRNRWTINYEPINFSSRLAGCQLFAKNLMR